MNIADVTAALARIEQRQQAYEVVARRILDTLEIHTEKLDAILEAATREAGPSPVADALQAILAAMQEQAALLEALPDSLAHAIRDMDADEGDMVAAGNGAAGHG